jgi:quinol monooxygenase YgiN
VISFVVRLKFAQEDRADVVETLRLLTAASRQEPGCVSYIPHHLDDDPDTVVIYEQYVDAKLYQKLKERSVENLVALV